MVRLFLKSGAVIILLLPLLNNSIMQKQIIKSLLCLLLIGAGFYHVQAQGTENASATKPSPEETTAKANAELEKKTAEWVADLHLNDAAKESFVVGKIEDADSEMVHRDAITLGDLASMTGGRMSNAQNSARSVEAQMAEIARGLKTQYLIGFKSSRKQFSMSWSSRISI